MKHQLSERTPFGRRARSQVSFFLQFASASSLGYFCLCFFVSVLPAQWSLTSCLNQLRPPRWWAIPPWKCPNGYATPQEDAARVGNLLSYSHRLARALSTTNKVGCSTSSSCFKAQQQSTTTGRRVEEGTGPGRGKGKFSWLLLT